MDLGFHPVPKPSHRRKVQKQANRSKFSKMVRDEIKEKNNNLCQMCGRLAFHLHHCMPRSRGGRNVFTNAVLLCAACHRKVHADESLLKYWINEHKKLYGKDFFRDKEDLIFKYQKADLKEMGEEVDRWVKYNEKFNYVES